MRGPRSSECTTGLVESMEILRRLETQDEGEAWRRTVEVLAWLYRSEESERKADPGYYADRAASVAGQTLAALTWYRAKVEHDQADVRHLAWQPTELLVMTPEGLKPVRTRVMTPEGLKPVRTRVAAWSWPQMPDTVHDERGHGRDALYRLHVAGKRVLPPLEAALAYLAAR